MLTVEHPSWVDSAPDQDVEAHPESSLAERWQLHRERVRSIAVDDVALVDHETMADRILEAASNAFDRQVERGLFVRMPMEA